MGLRASFWGKGSPSSQEAAADWKRGGGHAEYELLAQPFFRVIKDRGILSGSEQDTLPPPLAAARWPSESSSGASDLKRSLRSWRVLKEERSGSEKMENMRKTKERNLFILLKTG